MTLASDIRDALLPIGLPVYAHAYTGAEEAYLVYNWTRLPDNFADDMPQHERGLVQVHLYCPHTRNTSRERVNIRWALVCAGFTYPSEVDAGDERTQHVVFECERAEAM